ncbi:MAG: hypothetical protein ACREID_02000, partial [Planctomycetota bacterium]
VLLPAWAEAAREKGGVRVHLPPTRRTGGPGFRFACLLPGREYRVLLTRPGGVAHATESFVAPEAGREQELPPVALPDAPSIRGVVDGALPSLFGLRVECRGPEGSAVCRTDRAGRFLFPGLEPGVHVLSVLGVDETGLRIELEGSRDAEVTLPCAASSATRAISGHVFDADGKPLFGVEVEAAGVAATSGLEGEFALSHLPRGFETVNVSFRPGPKSPGCFVDPHLPVVQEKVRVRSALRVLLPRAGTLRVVLDAAEKRLARETLHLKGTSGFALRRRLPRGAREVVIPELPVGSYIVELSAPGVLGTAGAIVRVAASASAPVTVPVAPGRSASGRVVLKRAVHRAGGSALVLEEPPGTAWVTLLDPDPLRAEAFTPVEEDGSFLLAGLPPRGVLLAAAGPGLPP